MVPREEVYRLIDGERAHQEQKWGTIEAHPHEVGGWLLIMEQLLAKARAAWVGSRGDTPALDELRQVVSTGIACLEQHGCPPRKRAIADVPQFGKCKTQFTLE